MFALYHHLSLTSSPHSSSSSSSSSHTPGWSSSPDSRHPVSLGSLLDDQHWHHVAVEHHGTNLNLTVDRSTLWVQIPARFTHWDHDQVCKSQTKTNTYIHSCSHLFVFPAWADECGSGPGPRLWIQLELPRLFGKSCVQRPEPGRPR